MEVVEVCRDDKNKAIVNLHGENFMHLGQLI